MMLPRNTEKAESIAEASPPATPTTVWANPKRSSRAYKTAPTAKPYKICSALKNSAASGDI